MRLPRVRLTVRMLMVVVAEAALACAAFVLVRYWCLLAILPVVGAIRGGSHAAR
jgi:hypothetical protein